MVIKLMACTPNQKKIFRESAIESICSANFVYLDELPYDLGPGEILFVELDEVTDELLDEVQYTKVKFLFLTDTLQGDNVGRFISLGGNCPIMKSLSEEDFISEIIRRIHQKEMFKLLHLVSPTDVELFRFIHRAGNGEKSKLSELIFGSTSESTIDVNLSRLRKKLRDPEVGNDFFRIITKNGRLYIVSCLTNYEIPGHLLKNENKKVI